MDWDPGVSFDVLMARISSNVRASTSRVKGDAEYVSGSWDLSAIRELFDEVVPGSGGWASSTTAWMVAAILRYCDDAGAPVTPDVFGSAVLGFQRVFSCQPPGTFLIEGFPFEEQLREDAVVAWACWTAWYICVRDGSRKWWPAALLTSSSTPSSFSLLRAMVCCHAPRPDYLGSRHFDQMMVYLRGSLLLVDESMLRSSFGRWYSGQCAKSCLALADQAHVTRGEQLMALTELADAADGTQRTHQGNEEFVLAATSALTRAGGLILSPEAASEVLRVLSFSTQRFSSTYRSLIQSLMAVYIDMPAHADMVLDRWELFDPRVALAVLLPACHSLSASTITSKLAPICLDLLQECHRKAMQDEGGSSSGLLRLLQDVCVCALTLRFYVVCIYTSDSPSLAIPPPGISSWHPDVPQPGHRGYEVHRPITRRRLPGFQPRVLIECVRRGASARA